MCRRCSALEPRTVNRPGGLRICNARGLVYLRRLKEEGVTMTVFRARGRQGLLVAAFVAACIAIGCTSDTYEPYTAGGRLDAGPPSMSPDGRYVVYASARTGRGDIYRLDIGSRETKRLTDSDLSETYPVCTADGEHIVFVQTENEIPKIWVMTMDGSKKAKVTIDEDSYGLKPHLSRDGSKVYFGGGKIERTTFGHSLGNVRYYVIRIDGTQRRLLATMHDSIAPSGEATVYHQRVPGSPAIAIWTRSADGSRKKLISYGRLPSFSRSGKRIVCLSDTYQPEIQVMDADGKNNRIIKIPKGYHSPPRFCLKDTHVLLRIDKSDLGYGDIVLVNLEDSTSRVITSTK